MELPPPSPPELPPWAILQAGTYPLWFQLTAEGPVQMEAIEDACFSTALIPWPYAQYIRFTLARGNELLMAVNREGFISFAPRGEGQGVAAYRFSGGEFWRHYTVGAFTLFNEKPAALLYRDDRFIETDAPLPSPRLWTFDRNAAAPAPLAMPVLDAFAPQDGWDIDALRQGADDQWYFRAVKRTAEPEIRMYRTPGLALEGERVSLGAFQNSALPRPLSSAETLLGEMLAAAFAESGGGHAAIVSPEFQSTCHYTIDRENAALLLGFYAVQPQSSGAVLLAALSAGEAFYLEKENAEAPAVRRFSLPALPEGFVYTGIGVVGNTIIASWEEQHEYSIGAAGFMVIALPDR